MHSAFVGYSRETLAIAVRKASLDEEMTDDNQVLYRWCNFDKTSLLMTPLAF